MLFCNLGLVVAFGCVFAIAAFELRFCGLPVTSGLGCFDWLLFFLYSGYCGLGLVWIGFLLLDCRALPCGFVMIAIWNCHFLVFGFLGFLEVAVVGLLCRFVLGFWDFPVILDCLEF